jgi:hypothetical protein
MKLYGLMITKDDDAIFGDWCRNQLANYDAVICLDGSETDATACIAMNFSERLIYLHERHLAIAHKTDHGLRRLVHQEIVKRFGFDNWIMCCHADEFCYHDPRKIAVKAEQEGFDLVSWYSLHFFPHPVELRDWSARHDLPIYDRFRYYHWNLHGSGLPWCEDRLYRNSEKIVWDEITHGSVRPHYIERPANFHPILKHYKVFNTNLAWYQSGGPSTLYRHHWQGQKHRTGLPFRVERLEDLFVRFIPNYTRCDRFNGTFNHPWNMGEGYRPEAEQHDFHGGRGL